MDGRPGDKVCSPDLKAREEKIFCENLGLKVMRYGLSRQVAPQDVVWFPPLQREVETLQDYLLNLQGHQVMPHKSGSEAKVAPSEEM